MIEDIILNLFNTLQEKGHGYFRKRDKALVSMITVFGSLMLSSYCYGWWSCFNCTNFIYKRNEHQVNQRLSNETTMSNLLQHQWGDHSVSNPLQQLVRKPPKTSSSEETSSLPSTASATELTTVVLQWQQALITHQNPKRCILTKPALQLVTRRKLRLISTVSHLDKVIASWKCSSEAAHEKRTKTRCA